MPFLNGSLPVATAVHTGPGCVGRIVATCIEAPASSSRAKCGSRPSAAIGASRSSDAPSSRISVTLRSPAGVATTAGGRDQRTGRAGPVPGPRSISGTASEAISVRPSAAAPGRELCRRVHRWPTASATINAAQTVRPTAPGRHAPLRVEVEHRAEAAQVHPHQQRPEQRRARRHPDEEAEADPAGRDDFGRHQLPEHDQRVERRRRVRAVRQDERGRERRHAGERSSGD